MMASVTAITPANQSREKEPVPQLENGDRLTRAEFERRYDAMPDLKKAELIEGVVYIPSPARHRRHSHPHTQLVGWLFNYEAGTPGDEAGDNGSIWLDLDNEPQPDAYLIIDPEKGGQSQISSDDYIEGAPELVGEVASSSVSYVLNVKLKVYRRSGVLEYVVWRVLDKQIDWFVLRDGLYEPMPAGTDGILRSTVFPGLWLDPRALLGGDLSRLLGVLEEGMKTTEHGEFVARLQHEPGRP
jgi:Uma2 family endonuclease